MPGRRRTTPARLDDRCADHLWWTARRRSLRERDYRHIGAADLVLRLAGNLPRMSEQTAPDSSPCQPSIASLYHRIASHLN